MKYLTSVELNNKKHTILYVCDLTEDLKDSQHLIQALGYELKNIFSGRSFDECLSHISPCFSGKHRIERINLTYSIEEINEIKSSPLIVSDHIIDAFMKRFHFTVNFHKVKDYVFHIEYTGDNFRYYIKEHNSKVFSSPSIHIQSRMNLIDEQKLILGSIPELESWDGIMHIVNHNFNYSNRKKGGARV